MINPFLVSDPLDIETALLLEKAIVSDIGKAIAYTDGKRVFINTAENLKELLPVYDDGMLKWLLWHERYHNELNHPTRYKKYEHLVGASELTHNEVNIIMDILVHDSLSAMFPELVETAIANLSQMRNCNSLKYTFKTYTLEEMLQEYSDYKKSMDKDGEDSKDGEPDKAEETEDKSKTSKPSDAPSKKVKDKSTAPKSDTESPDTSEIPDSKEEDKDSKEEEDSPTPGKGLEDRHDDVDWSKLEDINDKEFISESDADVIEEIVKKLKTKKFRLEKITETLNGLATSQRIRSYRTPSKIMVDKRVILKGRAPGKATLYLAFDASGSMTHEMNTFKEIISKGIPQAMECPCEWFAGHMKYSDTEHFNRLVYTKTYLGRTYERTYVKGKFKDFMEEMASGGFDDDGDRTLELCYQAEQQGYTPIGVTDGGGYQVQSEEIRDLVKRLKRTTLVCNNARFIEDVKSLNPALHVINIKE